jgi:hypothetical protein
MNNLLELKKFDINKLKDIPEKPIPVLIGRRETGMSMLITEVQENKKKTAKIK